jgi:hypothetical protein
MDTTVTYTEEQMKAIGGKRWTTGDHLRVYLNDWADMIDLDVNHYKTGNVQSATLAGDRISNTKASTLLQAKVWWEDGRIHTNLRRVANQASLDADALMDTLMAAIAERVAARPAGM